MNKPRVRPTQAEKTSTDAIARATAGHSLDVVLWMFANVIVSGFAGAGSPINHDLIGRLAASFADMMLDLEDQRKAGDVQIYAVQPKDTLQ